MAGSASGFVAFGSADENDWVSPFGRFAVDDSLGVVGGGTADHADGLEFDDFIGDGEEFGDGSEWHPPEILVKAGGDDFFSLVGDGDEKVDDGAVKELDFFDCDDVGLWV